MSSLTAILILRLPSCHSQVFPGRNAYSRVIYDLLNLKPLDVMNIVLGLTGHRRYPGPMKAQFQAEDGVSLQAGVLIVIRDCHHSHQEKLAKVTMYLRVQVQVTLLTFPCCSLLIEIQATSICPHAQAVCQYAETILRLATPLRLLHLHWQLLMVETYRY